MISMCRRHADRSDPPDPICLHLKRRSWLNQVELWFSLLERASFTSLDDRRRRILAFIDDFDQDMAKPFRWTCKGELLAA
jgi:hypothetical protein